MDSRKPSKGVIATRPLAVLAALVLCAGWSTAALSAASTEADCAGVAGELESLATPVETPAVTLVDHVTIEPGPTHIGAPDVQSAVSETATPYLYLTPRVASVLRDVFAVDREDLAADADAEASSSPLAETEKPAGAEAADDERHSPRDADPAELPLFQRQMYRIDI